MKKITTLWEERSKKYRRSPEGVLSKSFPRPINDFLDLWMYKQVVQIVGESNHIKVLDLGCGYGRLSKKILKDFKNAETVGVDFAKTYVDIYNHDLKPRGKAVAGDIRSLSFPTSYFDAAFMVTTLMYLVTTKDQNKAIGELFRVLKPGKKFVIIERNPLGHQIITLGGLISKVRGMKHREIDSVGFTKDYLTFLIEKNGGKVTQTCGIPLWTLLFPMTFIISILSQGLGKAFLSFLMEIEGKLHLPLTFSLYIAYTGECRK